MKTSSYNRNIKTPYKDLSALSPQRLWIAGAIGIAALLYFSYKKVGRTRQLEFHQKHGHDRIDEASMESFPASDAPASY